MHLGEVIVWDYSCFDGRRRESGRGALLDTWELRFLQYIFSTPEAASQITAKAWKERSINGSSDKQGEEERKEDGMKRAIKKKERGELGEINQRLDIEGEVYLDDALIKM